MPMQILQTRLFERQKKKLKKNQVADLDEGVQAIAHDPRIGEEKAGDLKGVRVHKFQMVKQETLLAYEWDGKSRIVLLALGPHENFYRKLKRYVR
jgi:mRNA-degrading endonuclease RelE of RelBE toxin-antitoxin system